MHADRGVTVVTAPVDRLADAIGRDIDVVAFSAVQSATGEVADLAAISRAAWWWSGSSSAARAIRST